MIIISAFGLTETFLFLLSLSVLSHVLGAVDKSSSSFSAHVKIGNFIIIIMCLICPYCYISCMCVRLLWYNHMSVCMISWMICSPCEITDQLTHKTAFQLGFNFYTPYTNIKTSDTNAPLPDKKWKKIFVEGHRPVPDLPHWGRGYPSPELTFLGASILAPSALCSHSFSFTTQTLASASLKTVSSLVTAFAVESHHRVEQDLSILFTS